MVFGFEHGGYLLQISAVTLLFQVWQEEDRDDPLCDVGEIEVIVPLHDMFHHLICTFTPGDVSESEQLQTTEVFVGFFVILVLPCYGASLLLWCGFNRTVLENNQYDETRICLICRL